MRWTHWAGIMFMAARLGLCQEIDVRIREILGEGQKLQQQGKRELAEERFQQLIQLARQEKHAWGEAEGHRCLGQLLNNKADFKRARAELESALELHRTTGDRLALGRTLNALGYNDWGTGDRTRAKQFYLQALAEFEASGDKAEIATELYNLAFISNSPEETMKWIPRALEAARATGNKQLEGVTLHLWGDRLFAAGDYRQAIGKLQEALRLLEEAGAAAPQARVLISLGRLYRTHFRPENALASYRRALETAQKQGDKLTIVYCLRSIGIVQDDLGQRDEAMSSLEKALDVARQAGSPRLVREATVNIAGALNRRGRYADARKLLEELPDQEIDHSSQLILSISLRHLGNYRAAVSAATVALEYAAKTGLPGSDYFGARALAYDKLGEREASLSDIRRALAIVESNRTKLIPTDYLKRGFEEGKSGLYEAAIDIFHRADLAAEAFEVAEKARARAFLDLVASRELQRGIDDPAPTDLADSNTAKEKESIDLQSLSSVPSLSAAEAKQRARSLASTLLSYWVGKDATWIWVVPPEGEIRSVCVDATAKRLGVLVEQTSDSNLGLTRGGNGIAEYSLLTRGGSHIHVPRDSGDPWRELYRILVEPVAGLLPPGQGKSVTIVPHGPLFRLSFAALKNANSRYLIEDFTLGYAPSIALPGFSSAGQQLDGGLTRDYFLVANPRRTPPGPEGKPLPALPGAQRETADIARLLQKNSCTLLTGLRASEPAVRSNLSNKRVIHFATHGVLLDDQPFESYLALGQASKSPAGDGRLTTAEIYSLRLTADLVVLSACRSGLGSVTGDGVNGLTRAFFYAGANTVMATLWDVPDQPTNRLISGFYRHYQRNEGKSISLRTAQLELLNALRKGEISVDTPLGSFRLPENPLLWAGFIVIGKP